MNTRWLTKSVSVAWFRAALIGGCVGLTTASLWSQEAVPSPSVKTHTLFMGVDLSVAQEKQFYHVRDVAGGSFVIDVKGRPEFIAMDRFLGAPINLRVDPALKLSRLSATLTNLKGERAYTAGNNPRMALSSQQADTQIALSDKASIAEAHAMNLAAATSGTTTLTLETADSLNSSHPWTWKRAGGRPISSNQVAQIVNESRDTSRRAAEAMSVMTDPLAFQKRLEVELAKELYDAMEVNFEAACAEPLNNPFVVVITRFHDKDAKPGQSKNWIYAKSLDPITDRGVKVHVLQGGFPKGFVVESYQVHLFNQGLEVATNVAPKRVPLTLDEAATYMNLEYQRLHKADTLPAKVALTQLPADFQTRLARGEGKAPLWVKVSAAGGVTGAFLDEECAEKVTDAFLLAAVRDIRFQPALEKGKPVESLSRLKLTDLPRAL